MKYIKKIIVMLIFITVLVVGYYYNSKELQNSNRTFSCINNMGCREGEKVIVEKKIENKTTVSQGYCSACGCPLTEAECQDQLTKQGSGNQWCENNPSDCNCPGNCIEQKQQEKEFNDKNQSSKDKNTYKPGSYCWRGIPCDSSKPVANGYVYSYTNPKQMDGKTYSKYKVQGEEKSKYCDWVVFDSHFDGTDCCEQRDTCWVKDGVEYYGDYEFQKGYTTCEKYCFGNGSTKENSDVFYYGYKTSLYKNEFWNYIAGYQNTLLYDPDYTPLRITTKEKNELIVKAYGKMRILKGVSEADCHGDVPNRQRTACDPVPSFVTSKSTKEVASCEGTIVNTYDDSIKCDTATTSGFYTIDCKTDVTTSFDMGEEGIKNQNSINIYSGEGIDYKITANIVKKCEGKFDVDLWNNLYRTNERKMRDEKVGSEAWFKYVSIIEELKDVVVAYNKWNSEVNYNPKVKLNLANKPLTGSTASYSGEYIEFVSKVIKDGNSNNNKKNTSSVKLADNSVVNNFTYSNEKNPRVIEFTPPETFFDAKTGKEATNATVSKISGGNKIYTKLDLKVGKYPYKITIEDLPDSNNVINDKCVINVDTKDILYRIVDVSNPFLNDDYNKGENWENNKYDYTQVIDKDIWSKCGLYVFNLLKETIKSLQKSNNGNIEKYLGTCDLPSSEMDEITKQICNIINNPKK